MGGLLRHPVRLALNSSSVEFYARWIPCQPASWPWRTASLASSPRIWFG